ncbi:TauD/TfdA family dioxygenase [Catellatospora tritici]|uniref:TauD/TfdA family dioxygenase n=1 Tax=Catellatospora tritici TaxID=2851566 RepID=UPI001C2DEFA5|nr:TauD/TfdA family dioxygenase [Catellatospora tritici]MBV1850526.1 TauD/TfdA family dioxygenase [Catellatospora tritici]
MTLLDIETERDELARELVHAASVLAADGVTADSVLARAAAALPAQTRARLTRLTHPPRPGAGYRVVKGLFAAFGEQGPTATHWKDVDRERTARFDIGLTIVAALHGEVFGWENQQDGHIVHNILPAPGYETVQVGGSSIAPLTWHTEDAFHPDRADFLLLACVRNPDGVGSRIATAGAVELSDEHVAELSEPKLVIFPDASYEDDVADCRTSQGMATLWHRDGRLCLRYDPTYTRMLGQDDGFQQAYDRLGRQLDETSFVVELEQGDLLIIDNDVAVHGRGSFRARYDGTDRWLKRVLVRAPRARPESERREHGFGQAQVRA